MQSFKKIGEHFFRQLRHGLRHGLRHELRHGIFPIRPSVTIKKSEGQKRTLTGSKNEIKKLLLGGYKTESDSNGSP